MADTWSAVLRHSNDTLNATPTPVLFAPTPTPSRDTSVPAGCPQYYTVREGDAITQIAGWFGTDWRTVWKANPQVADPGILTPGQQLCIPVAPLITTSAAGGPPSTPIGSATASQIAQRIREVFGSYGDQAVRVATCESGLDAQAYNPIVVANGHAKGVFQIIDATWATTSERDQSPYNAEANIQAAWEIFSRDGHRWFEWVCQP